MKTARIIFAIIFAFFINFLSAQNIEWQNSFGGSSFETFYSVALTSDGGSICAGSSNSPISGDKTENSQGSNDFWIVKLDSAGVIQWDNTIGGNNFDYVSWIQQTADGGYICGGQSNSDISGDKTESCKGNYDYWVVKLDASGVIQWQNTIGSLNFDQLRCIQEVSGGGYILAGDSDSNNNGDKTENSNGLTDFWIVRLNATGGVMSQNTIGGANLELPTRIVQTSDGGFICGGHSLSNISGDKTENCIGEYDFWIMKLSPTLTIQWQNTIGGNKEDKLYDIIPTLDGGYICGGSTKSGISGDKAEDSLGGFDFWIVKLNSTGIVQWENTIGGSSDDMMKSIIQTLDGGFICAGESKSGASKDKLHLSRGYIDYWVIKLNENGYTEWQKTIGGDNYDQAFTIRQTPDRGYVIGGQSASGISGEKSEMSMGVYDYWVVKLEGRENLITGNLFMDLNSNGTFDGVDVPVSNKMIIAPGTGKYAITDLDGNYSLSVNSSGNYQVEPATAIDYYIPIPASHTANFSGILQTDSLNNFAYQPAGTYNDLCINVTPTGQLRTGREFSYMINYTNLGTTVMSPTIVFYPDANLTYVSASVVPSSITPDSVIFAVNSIGPFESGSILVTVLISISAPTGTIINSGTLVLPASGDANPVCNTDYIEAVITGSYDPNDILVNRDSLFNFELINPEPLEYIIRFQNTGNDTAFYVRVDNKISAYLQLNTFEFVASSHPCNIEYQSYDSTMKFTFNNILLPDSNINEPASHGFVRYKIKPQTNLIVGDSIRNSAGIYFDYNAPVWTNIAVTEIVLPTGLSQHSGSGNRQLNIYPNPANHFLTVDITNKKSDFVKIELYNIYGQKINTLFKGKLDAGKHKINFDVSHLSNGMYFIKTDGSFSESVRFNKY